MAAAVLVVGPGYETSQVRMHSGAVWLASTRTGQVTLVDGASAEVKTHVPIAGAGAALTVTQQGGAAYVLNAKTGGLSRIDSATEQISHRVTVLPASDGLVVLPSPDALHAVDVHSGLLAAVDPATLAPKGEPEHLAEAIRPGNVAVDGRGRVWAVDDRTGDLVWSSGGRRAPATAPADGRLAITRGRPALVSPGRGTAELLDPEDGTVRQSLRPSLLAGDSVVVSGSADESRLLIAVRTRGELISCSFDSGSCAEPVQVASPGAELGTPVEVDDHAVVPDHSTGQATIVDLARSRVVSQRRLFTRPTPFELIAQDGIVFFNDPGGDQAGVLDLWGEPRTITKYTEDPTADEVSPVPDRSTRADEVKQAVHEKPKVGLGLPHQTGRPDLVVPAASPTPSIVVRPGNRGVVGDEFELTLALHPTAEATVRWSFGDDTGASGSPVRHTWSQPGVFTVRATATFGTGKQAETETTVTVDPPDTPTRITELGIRRPKPVIGEPVHFSADTTRKPDGWEWTVTRRGEPVPEVTARTAEFDHAFATPGHYTVALTVTRGSQTARSSRQFTVARGAVKGWGDNERGQTDVPPEAGSGVIAVDAGGSHSLALKANGSVLAWGDNENGQAAVPADALTGVVAIAAGGEHSLALKADGSVLAWGLDEDKQATVPEEALTGVVAIAAGATHSLALKSDGSVLAWGDDALGQKDVPLEAGSGVVAIAAGVSISLALKADGSILVWGDTRYGVAPVPPGIPGGVRAVAVGARVCLALKEDGSLVTWGDGRSRARRAKPEEAGSGVIAMDFSSEHVLALKADGTAFGWGEVDPEVSDVPAEYNRGVLAVAAGYSFNLILLEEVD
jgi:hypothetical protein